MDKARIFLVSLKVGDLGTRLATELVARNIAVAAFCHRRHLLSNVKNIQAFHRSWRLSTERSIARAIRTCKPSALVPCDDDAARMLHALHARYPDLRALIEHSVGDPQSYAATDSRAAFCAFMARCLPGVMPHDGIHGSVASLTSVHNNYASLVLKCDGLMSGKGVVLPSGAEDAVNFAVKVSSPRSALRTGLNRWLLDPIAGIRRCEYNVDNSAIVVQRRIDGWQANCAAYCVDGDIKALTIAEVVAHLPQGGPSTVIRLIEHAQMAGDVRRIAKQLRLTGFHGFDFIIDAAGKPWLLENNPRFTPTAHLVGQGGDLIDALCSHAGLQASSRPSHTTELIALFPRELSRDPRRRDYPHAYLDLPHTDEALAKAMRRRANQRDMHGILLRITDVPRRLLKGRCTSQAAAAPR